ncbi:hypothetical protein [Magnetofaba australis]|uniref:Carrier domain-containing protein n=1 Tax=Magnetofaba australis IT-1 TaxID=1434232 RepID=A0A1Y2K8Q0_9PROT|nr:hypothetical protein [Magnetofaba australis]OSM07121.1 hypothetical protein MAIT1_03967 [Magnetofaba australis IT-1]
MAQNRDVVEQAVYAALGAVNDELPPQQALPLEAETVLLGETSPLGSLQLVNLILAAESDLEQKLGVTLALTDHEEIFDDPGPLNTVSTLIDWILQVMND